MTVASATRPALRVPAHPNGPAAVALAGAPLGGASIVAAVRWPDAGLSPKVATGFLASIPVY